MKAILPVVLALALLTSAFAHRAQAPEGVSPELSAEILAEKARLAATGHFYLELSLSDSRISICHSGVSVQSYAILKFSIGGLRVFFFPKSKPPQWLGETWTLGHLEPAKAMQRIQIKPGDAATTPTPESPDVIPPTLEELTPVPQAYSIQFDDQRAIQVVLIGQIPGAVLQTSPAKARWGEFLAALGFRDADQTRIRIEVSAADGASLFRSFPDSPPELLLLP